MPALCCHPRLAKPFLSESDHIESLCLFPAMCFTYSRRSNTAGRSSDAWINFSPPPPSPRRLQLLMSSTLRWSSKARSSSGDMRRHLTLRGRSYREKCLRAKSPRPPLMANRYAGERRCCADPAETRGSLEPRRLHFFTAAGMVNGVLRLRVLPLQRDHLSSCTRVVRSLIREPAPIAMRIILLDPQKSTTAALLLLSCCHQLPGQSFLQKCHAVVFRFGYH